MLRQKSFIFVCLLCRIQTKCNSKVDTNISVVWWLQG